MKKSLLVAIVLLFGLNTFAQTSNNVQTISPRKNMPPAYEGVPSTWVTNPAQPKNHDHSKSITSGPVNALPIGQMINAFGMIGGTYQALWADQRINTVSFVHRSAPLVSGDPIGGYLRYDISTNRGNSFDSINCGPIYVPVADPGNYTTFAVARYPQGGIYNPPGNTVAANAYQYYIAPTRENSNGNTGAMTDWGGIGFGVKQFGGTTHTQRQDTSINPYWYIIPEGNTTTQGTNTIPGKVFNFCPSINETSGVGVYQDNIILNKGIFNTGTSDIDYTPNLVSAPVDVDNNGNKNYAGGNIAFSPDGKTGYMVVMGHQSYTTVPDSIFYPMVYKSTDSGVTWTGPTSIVMDNVASLLNNAATKFVTSFSIKCIVDNSGDLHFIVPVFAESGTSSSILIGPGNWGMFDVYTTDGGTSWFGHLLATPETFSATFGAGTTQDPTITEYTRGQASSTWDGTKLFFTWFDTDTITYGSAAGNSSPDMHSVGFNTTNSMWTSDMNFTTGTNAGGAVTFGLVSEYVFDSSGTYNIPAVYEALQAVSSSGEQTQLNYIQNADFTDASFSIPIGTNTVPLTTLNGIPTVTDPEFTLLAYPNPATNFVQVSYNLKHSAPVTMEILDILGNTVTIVLNNQTQAPGIQSSMINVSNLSSGVYMIRTKIGDTIITKKLTKI